MSVAKKLDKASGLFFFAGFLLSKLQYIPFPQASAILRFISLGIYLMAYGCWHAASLLHPDQKVRKNKWYSFAQIKEQFLFSSLVGFIATVMSIAAVFIPVLFPPAAWLFLVGNAIWTIGEYNKFKNPPQNDANFSYTRQKSYLYYSVTSTSISLITAVSATLIFVFPPIAIPITIFSLILCVGLGVFAFEFWLDSSFGDHKPTPVPGSYNQISDTLGPSVSQELTDSPEPNCSNCLFLKQKESKTPENIELLSADNTEENSEEHSLGAYSSL